MYRELGRWSSQKVLAMIIVGATILVISGKSFIPAMTNLHKTGILLCSTILFFIVNILDIDDLEEIPWNIILLFAGAMSIGFCLWETGAAKWMAVNWLTCSKSAPAIVFILGMAFFVMIMTNFIMNVAAIAISLPVALVIAPYLGVAGEVILFSALVVAGMPFLLLVGAAPNAIAYTSKQFTTGEFFFYGIPASHSAYGGHLDRRPVYLADYGNAGISANLVKSLAANRVCTNSMDAKMTNAKNDMQENEKMKVLLVDDEEGLCQGFVRTPCTPRCHCRSCFWRQRGSGLHRQR